MATLALSEAIRLGAMLKPKTREKLKWAGRSCAIGAALDAAGELAGTTNAEGMEVAKELWPLLHYITAHPQPGTSHTNYGWAWTIEGIIVSLNDDHGWSRERIADWVEQQEVRVGLSPSGQGARLSTDDQREKIKIGA